MKKIVCVFLAVLIAAAAFGCGRGEDLSSGEEDIPVDVDLTVLSSTMVYSEVYNMVMHPADYVGKTVKMTGQFVLYQAVDSSGKPVPGQIYYACVIADATACCQQGLEFILDGDPEYPEGYPEIGTQITVWGEFNTYMEGTLEYCHLTEAHLM